MNDAMDIARRRVSINPDFPRNAEEVFGKRPRPKQQRVHTDRDAAAELESRIDALHETIVWPIDGASSYRYKGPFAYSIKPGYRNVIVIAQGYIRIGDAYADWPTKLQDTGAWPAATPDEYDTTAIAAGDYCLSLTMQINSSGVFDATHYPILGHADDAVVPPAIFYSGAFTAISWSLVSFTITAGGALANLRQRQHGDIIFPTAFESSTSGHTISSRFDAP